MSDLSPTRQPSLIREIAEEIGERAAARLVERFGGREIRIPMLPSADHPIIEALGEADGLALCQFLGAERIYVPHLRPRASKREAIRELHAQGLTRGEIARILRITERHVRRAANAPAPDPRQGELFRGT